MEAVKINKTIENDGQIFLSDLPYKKGQTIEMIIFMDDDIGMNIDKKQKLTVKKLLKSKLVGLWEKRKDIKNSTEYARELRNQTQNRR